jgi:hypothetical protein
MSANWLTWPGSDPIDLDLGLIEIRDNADEPWTMRAIAGHSVGMPVEEGCRAVRNLHRAVALLADGVGEGRAMLAGILGEDRIDYQRSLFYALAGRGPIAMVVDLGRLSILMEARVALARWAAGQGLKTTLQQSPYRYYDGAEVPPASFSAAFALSDAWQRFIGNGRSN